MAKKLRFFKVVIDDENLLFFPGSFLTGKVVLEVDDDISIIGLYFHIIGEGVVRLVGSGGIVSSDKENYIDFRMKLLGDNFTRIGEFHEFHWNQVCNSITWNRSGKYFKFKLCRQ